MAFTAKIQEAGMFKRMIESLREICTKANLSINPDCLRLQGLDNSRVSMVVLELLPSFFIEYSAPKELRLCFKTEHLHKTLKFCQDSDVLTLSIDESDSLTLLFESPASSKIERQARFQLALSADPDEELLPPELKYPVSADLPAQTILTTFRNFAQVTDSLKFSANKKTVRFSFASEVTEGEMEFGEGESLEGGRVRVHVDEPCERTFNLGIVNNVLKVVCFGLKLTFNFGKDQALCLVGEMGEKGRFMAFVAPKLED